LGRAIEGVTYLYGPLSWFSWTSEFYQLQTVEAYGLLPPLSSLGSPGS